MSYDHHLDPEPSEAPSFKRELHFYFYQYLGFPLLLLIPLLAFLGIRSNNDSAGTKQY
jgi:hypothetical protein